jgi:hypothetical protein
MVRVIDLIVPRKSPWKRLRVHDGVNVGGRSETVDGDWLISLRWNLLSGRPSRKLGYARESRDAELGRARSTDFGSSLLALVPNP